MADEVGLPKATMQRVMKDRLPAGMAMAADAREIVTKCCEEFVHLISATANELSEQEKKSTITPEHVLKALQDLGYTPYLAELTAALEEWKSEKKEERKAEKEKKAARANAGGMTAEQMLELQQRLFAQARERTLADGAAPAAPPQAPEAQAPAAATAAAAAAPAEAPAAAAPGPSHAEPPAAAEAAVGAPPPPEPTAE